MTAEEYFKITELFPVGVCVIDSDYRIIFWNRLLEDWSGKRLKEIQFRSLFELYPHLSEIMYSQRIADVLKGGPPAIFTSQLHNSVIPLLLASGEPRIQTTTILPFRMGDESVAVMVIEDLSELKKEVLAYRKMKDSAIIALNERIEAEKEVIRANDEANLYLDIMSHDIANINMLVSGYSALLEESPDKMVSTYSKRISIAASRSSDIINSVSTIRKLMEKKAPLEPMSLKDVVLSGVSQYGAINLEMFDGDFTVMADDLLPEIFVNLVGNSLKYGEKDIRISITAKSAEDIISVCVSDNGPGISDEIKPEVFERFKRGKGRAEAGSGLGLYIVKMLAERYGGEINIKDSYPGRKMPGLTICFTLKKG
ncbi:MAG: PAS domain-containing sensor histidine kinase [Methanomicrobiaceae archaeon]|nr:PAS domain-containing sensor histidine kinase [Methanomicrobiaceae archaeon]